MKGQEPWWPGGWGEPSTAGSQGDLRYAFFADRQRLALSRAGEVAVYDTGDHKITGASQHQGDEQGDITFTTPDGAVALSKLKVVD